MNQTPTTAPEQVVQAEANEISILELLIVLAKHKRKLLVFPLACAAAGAAISLALPNVYRATTTILPPQQAQSGAASLLSQLGGSAGAFASAAGIKNPNELYVGMLASRTIGDKLINRYQLKKSFETDSDEKARARLKELTSISAGKDGLITINVDAESKKLAASLANSYVEELLELCKVLAVTEASQRRLFFERQLGLAKNNLADAEVALRRALDSHGVVSIDNESSAMVETVGKLRAQISAKEIQIGSMQAFVTQNNQDYKRAQEELSSLRQQLAKLENGGQGAFAGDSNGAGQKQAGFESIKMLRDVKYYQMLYELLAKQYEAARLDEARDASLIQVLDRAVEPEHKVKPKRALIVILAGLAGFVLAVIGAFFVEFRERLAEFPVEASRWKRLGEQLKFGKAKSLSATR